MSPDPTETSEVLDPRAVSALAAAIRPAELSAAQRASMWARVLSRASEAQPALTETIRTGDIPWRNVSSLTRAKVLKRDESANVMIVLWQLEPGGCVPGHPHDTDEECLVLEGEMAIGAHRVGAGELHIAKPGAIHADLTTRTGCVLLVRSGISPLLGNIFPSQSL